MIFSIERQKFSSKFIDKQIFTRESKVSESFSNIVLVKIHSLLPKAQYMEHLVFEEAHL